jgi:hypothetical protein
MSQLNIRRILGVGLAVALLAVVTAQVVLATANYVYHEKSTNTIVAAGGAGNGSYTQPYFATLGGAHGVTPWSTDTVTVRFKSEYQFWTNQVRLYYTTDGSTPSGSFGTGTGTTSVVTCSYEGTFVDTGPDPDATVDVAACTIPAQAKGTTVKYIVSAWHSGGGIEVFANNGSGGGSATVFSYTTLGPTAVTLNTFAANSGLALPAVAAALALGGLGAVAVWRRR